DAPALFAALQARRIDQDAGLGEFLVIGAHLREQALRGHLARLGVPGGLDQNHEFHCYLLEGSMLLPIVEWPASGSTAAAKDFSGAGTAGAPARARSHREAPSSLVGWRRRKSTGVITSAAFTPVTRRAAGSGSAVPAPVAPEP